MRNRAPRVNRSAPVFLGAVAPWEYAERSVAFRPRVEIAPVIGAADTRVTGRRGAQVFGEGACLATERAATEARDMPWGGGI